MKRKELKPCPTCGRYPTSNLKRVHFRIERTAFECGVFDPRRNMTSTKNWTKVTCADCLKRKAKEILRHEQTGSWKPHPPQEVKL